MSKFIYFDNNATTAVTPEVQKTITKALKSYGNPSSLHFYGVQASEELQKARAEVARAINAHPEEIIFTASGSEGNNLCIRGFAEANKDKGNHIITTAIEHPSVINACKHLEEQGFSVTYLNVDSDGFVNLDELREAISDKTILVSIMYANNEIGTVQNLREIATICSEHNVSLHTDAVQGFTKLPFDVQTLPVSLATFAGHKIHAPKGIGFVYRRKEIKLRREIDGGGQEFNLRAGTENLPYILGLAKAVFLTTEKDVEHMKKLQKYLIDKLIQLPNIRLNGTTDLTRRICTNINISFENLEAEKLLNKLSDAGICVSTGSACSSKSTKTSPVLLAIQCPTEYIHGNLRISISKYTTKREVDYLLINLKRVITDENAQKIYLK